MKTPAEMIAEIEMMDDGDWIAGLVESGKPELALVLVDVRLAKQVQVDALAALHTQMIRVSDYGDCV